MAKRKDEPRTVHVDPQTGELREGREPTAKRPGLLDSIKRAASDAVVRRTSTRR